jgi:hypothetical protein
MEPAEAMTGAFERPPEASAKPFAAFSIYLSTGAGSTIGEIGSDERMADMTAMPAPEAGTSR